MKRKTINLLRNIIHPIATCIIFYTIGVYVDLTHELFLVGAIFVSLFGGGIGAGFLGAMYEIYKLGLFREPADSWDVYRSAFGGIIGFSIAWFYPFVSTQIIDNLLYSLFGIFLLDLGYSIYKPKTKKK